jgi:hypothetical protein
MDTVYTPINSESSTADTKAPKQEFFTALVEYGTRIIKDHELTGTLASETMYTVPEGKIFYIFHAQVSCLGNQQDEGITFGIIQIINGTQAFGLVDTQGYYTTVGGVPIFCGTVAHFHPTVPVRMVGGERIDLFAGTNESITTGTIFGYEIDSSLVPNFI